MMVMINCFISLQNKSTDFDRKLHVHVLLGHETTFRHVVEATHIQFGLTLSKLTREKNERNI